MPQAGSNNWGPGFLPAVFQGTPMSAKEPVRHLAPPAAIAPASDEAARALLQRMNARHLEEHPGDGQLAARIASYELAARMQLSVPELSDLSSEPAHILKLYGADDAANPNKAGFARNCILARRMIERGVRFVQLFNGAYASGGELNWDGHSKLKEQYDKHAADPRSTGRRAHHAISNSAGSCKTRSSSGAPSSAACRSSKKGRKAATTIPTALPAG